jgi:Na+-translocating ferredoxin:NAD+ oxidoreductase subunit C
MEQAHLADCMLCGSCAYVCPSNIPLVQLFALSKKQPCAGRRRWRVA